MRRRIPLPRFAVGLSLVVLSLAGCDSQPATLRLVNGMLAADNDLAAAFAEATQEYGEAVRIDLLDRVDSVDAAFDALDRGSAELAIVANSPAYQRPELRTVAPLYPSVLHIGVRTGASAATLGDLLAGAKVLAGTETTPGRQLLEFLRTNYKWLDVDFEFVETMADDPDVVFLFAPISPQRAPGFAGYELYSLGPPESLGLGSVADGLSLVAPMIRPFVIPAGTYGDLTPEAVTTVAMDTLLITHEDTPDPVIYDLLTQLESIGPKLATQQTSFALDSFGTFDFNAVVFPVHSGAVKYRTRSKPDFYERAAGLIQLLAGVAAGLATAILAGWRLLRAKRKDRIDEIYARVLEIRAQIAQMDDAARSDAIREIRTIRDGAFSALMREKLDPNDSFRILQSLIQDVLAEAERGSDHHASMTAR